MSRAAFLALLVTLVMYCNVFSFHLKQHTRFGVQLSMAGGRSPEERGMSQRQMFRDLREKFESAAQMPGFIEVKDADAEVEIYCKSNKDGRQKGDCPYAQFIQLVLAKKGVKYTIKPTMPTNKPSWLVDKHNGQLPAIIHNGKTMTESLAIAEYLENAYPQNTLTRQGAYSYQEILEKTSRFFPSVSAFIKNKDESKDDILRAEVDRQLDILDELLRSTPGQYFCGIEMTLADLYLVPQLFNAAVALDHFKEFEFYHIESDATRPALEAYLERMFEMEEFNNKKVYIGADSIVFGWKVARGDIKL